MINEHPDQVGSRGNHIFLQLFTIHLGYTYKHWQLSYVRLPMTIQTIVSKNSIRTYLYFVATKKLFLSIMQSVRYTWLSNQLQAQQTVRTLLEGMVDVEVRQMIAVNVCKSHLGFIGLLLHLARSHEALRDYTTVMGKGRRATHSRPFPLPLVTFAQHTFYTLHPAQSYSYTPCFLPQPVSSYQTA